MWGLVDLLGPARVDSKGIFELVKHVVHPSLSYLAHWWRVPNQRDERKDTSPVLSFQMAWMHYPTVTLHKRKKISMKTKTVTNILYVKSWKERRSKYISIKMKKMSKRKSLMPGYREESMQEDTVGIGPFGYIASKTWNEDARKESFEHFFFLQITPEEKENPACVVHNLHFTQQQKNAA